MAEILHQLMLIVYLIIYKVLAPSQVVQDFSHQQYCIPCVLPKHRNTMDFETYKLSALGKLG